MAACEMTNVVTSGARSCAEEDSVDMSQSSSSPQVWHAPPTDPDTRDSGGVGALCATNSTRKRIAMLYLHNQRKQSSPDDERKEKPRDHLRFREYCGWIGLGMVRQADACVGGWEDEGVEITLVGGAALQ